MFAVLITKIICLMKMDLEKIKDLKARAKGLSEQVLEIRGRKRKPYHLTENSIIVNEIFDFYKRGGVRVCNAHEPLRGLCVVDNLSCIDLGKIDSLKFKAWEHGYTDEDLVRMHILSHIRSEHSMIHTRL
jgi:hypothetical protein